jgi:hypothetical protein
MVEAASVYSTAHVVQEPYILPYQVISLCSDQVFRKVL